MNLSEKQLLHLTEIARNTALKAAKFIAEQVQKDVLVEKKVAGLSLASQVVTEVDRMSQEIILSGIKSTQEEYDLGLLTEESEDDGSRLDKDYFWCIDPLDGTLCFTEKSPGFSVAVALISRHGIPQAGIVVNPLDLSVYHAIKGKGVYKNGQQFLPSQVNKTSDKFTLICDQGFIKWHRSLPYLKYIRKRIYEAGFKEMEIKTGGGAVMNAIYVLENSPSCYFKLPKETRGGGSFWDYGSTCCIFNEMSAVACDFHKSPLNLNKKDSVYMNENGVIFCTDELIRDIVIEMHKSV
jgi:3'-phosphoadenosine 5'-phosphosulfate (PAPS) 3'-phosphatase